MSQLNIRKVCLKLYYIYCGGNVYNNIHELQQLDKLTRIELQIYLQNKINKLMDYIKFNKYYNKKLYSNRHQNNEILFRNLPQIDKRLLIGNIEALIDNDFKQSYRSTSGTTGTPFRFPKDNIASGYMDAMMYIAYSWHGIGMCDKQALIWGRSIKRLDRLLQYCKDLLLNRKRLSAFEMNKSACTKYFKLLTRYKPRYFYSYSNALYQFALFIEECGYDGKTLGVAVAICTGEVLFPYQRDKIAAVFGCRVVNEYGSTENGIIGFECEYGRMHLMPTVFVEIDNPDENGVGEIVVTELNSRSIPFIKYKNGDLGRLVKTKCECRRPYDEIEIREGRIDGYIKCKNGRLVYDAILAYTLKDYATRFKAYQLKDDLLKVFLIPVSGYGARSVSDITKTLKKYLGAEMKIELIETTDIPSEKSGKFRYFVPLIDGKDL